MKKKAKKIERRLRGGKPVVPVICYMPEALHRSLKALAKRQGKTQDALINGWAERAVAGSANARKAKQKTERKIEVTAKKAVAKIAKSQNGAGALPPISDPGF